MIYKKEIMEQAIRILSIEHPDEIQDAISLACKELTPKTRDSASILPAHILKQVYSDLTNGMTVGEGQNPTHNLLRLNYFFAELHRTYGLRVCRNMLDARNAGTEASDLAKEIRRTQMLNHFEAAGVEVKGKPLGQLINGLTRPSHIQNKPQIAQVLSQT